MKKIKILHIAQSNGGVAEYLKMFFKYADKSKFELDLLCSKQYRDEKAFFKNIGCNIAMISMAREISFISDIKSVFQIARYIKKIKPDIIHLHSSKAGALGRLASIFSGIPVIYNPHGWSFDMNISRKKKAIYIFIEKFLGKFTKEIINISDYEKDCALKHNILSKEKIKVIYNGIEVEKYQEKSDKQKIMKELGIPIDAIIIGMVGRISEQKSPETFVEIANKLKSKIENCYFILVGDGELRSRVEKKIDEYSLKDKFLITGWTSEVARYVSTFNVALLTSKWEGFGLVLTEYMASGKPIVASNVGGIPDVIQNNYNGILVKQNDIDNFVKAILEIKNNHRLRFSLIENGYKVVKEKFNIYRVVREHEDLYEKIVANNLNSKII